MTSEHSSSKNTPSERTFFDAIRNFQLDEVRQRVTDEPNLLLAYDGNSFGATPLTLAVFRNDREMIDTLLDLNVDVNRPSNWWAGPWSPLHAAIHHGNDDLAEYLLIRGATLDVHTAASLNRMEDLQRLLDEAPERIHELGGDGCHPLHFAGSVESAELLLKRGADIEARDVDHFSTPAQYLAQPRPAVARFLFSQGAQPDIFSAVLSDDGAVVKALIADNPQVINERIDQDRFPPSSAHDVQNILTFTVGQHSTPLHAAAKSNRASMVDVLVAGGANVNVRGGYDDAAPLHIAAWENHADVAERLVACGADINLRSGQIHNNSPAGWAIVAGSDQVFQLLMDSGAERLDGFLGDAQAAVAGEFLKFKKVPAENYARILQRLKSDR